MLSSTLKRTAATLSVLAGVLAAAAPASAQIPPTTTGVIAVEIPGDTVKAPCTNSVSGTEMTDALRSANASASPTSQVFTSVSNATGTQIGSEGVTEPKAFDVSLSLGGFSRGGHLAYTRLDAKSAKEGLYFRQSVQDADMAI